MTYESSDVAAATHQCWSCKGEVAPTDSFCCHCGVKLSYPGGGTADKAQPRPILPSVNIHERLVAIEKLLLKTVIGVVALLLLVGWIALQMIYFGRL